MGERVKVWSSKVYFNADEPTRKAMFLKHTPEELRMIGQSDDDAFKEYDEWFFREIPKLGIV